MTVKMHGADDRDTLCKIVKTLTVDRLTHLLTFAVKEKTRPKREKKPKQQILKA